MVDSVVWSGSLLFMMPIPPSMQTSFFVVDYSVNSNLKIKRSEQILPVAKGYTLGAQKCSLEL